MKASKFSEVQKAFILKQGEQGTPVADICRKAGISQATYFNWKKRYGGPSRPCLRPTECRNGAGNDQPRTRLPRAVRELLKCLSGNYRDLPPEAPSFITRVCGSGFHSLRFRFGQARRARSPQIAQASGALLRAFDCRAVSVVGKRSQEGTVGSA